MKTKFVLPAVLIFIFGSSFSRTRKDAERRGAKQSSLHNLKKQKPFSFRIHGTAKNFVGKVIFLHHKWDDKDYTDSALIDKNSFTFELKSEEPNMYWFTLTRDVNAQPNAIFFADEASIKVTVNGDSLAAATIKGGPTENDYIQYRAFVTQFTLQQQKLQSEFNTASQNRDQAAVTKIQQDYQALGVKYIDGLKNFVKTHPKSAVSGYIIYKEFNNPDLPISHAEECLSYIDKSIENTKFLKLAIKKINDLKGTQVGGKATDFSQAAPDGKQIKLSDFRGKYLLVDFWASWCRPCRMENPNVVAAYNQFKDKGFTVLGVSLDSDRNQWIAAIDADHLTWSNVSDLKGGANEAATLYNIQNIPQNVLIDKEGIIVAKNLRGSALDEKLKELIK